MKDKVYTPEEVAELSVDVLIDMKKNNYKQFKRLNLTLLSDEMIDLIVPILEGHGIYPPPPKYRRNSVLVNEWRILGQNAQEDYMNSININKKVTENRNCNTRNTRNSRRSNSFAAVEDIVVANTPASSLKSIGVSSPCVGTPQRPQDDMVINNNLNQRFQNAFEKPCYGLSLEYIESTCVTDRVKEQVSKGFSHLIGVAMHTMGSHLSSGKTYEDENNNMNNVGAIFSKTNNTYRWYLTRFDNDNKQKGIQSAYDFGFRTYTCCFMQPTNNEKPACSECMNNTELLKQKCRQQVNLRNQPPEKAEKTRTDLINSPALYRLQLKLKDKKLRNAQQKIRYKKKLLNI